MSSYVSILLSPPKHILDKFLRIFLSFSKNKTKCSEYYWPSCIVSLTYPRLLVVSDRKPCTNWLSIKKGNLLACITETSKKSHWFQAQQIGGSNISRSWSRLPGLYLPLQQCFRRVFSIEYILPPSSPTSPHSRRSTSRRTSQYLDNTAGKELMAVSLQGKSGSVSAFMKNPAVLQESGNWVLVLTLCICVLLSKSFAPSEPQLSQSQRKGMESQC